MTPVLLLIVGLATCTMASPRIVCYYTNWSAYRQGPARFLPENINPYLCTHLIYAFGGFSSEWALKPFDKYQDLDKQGYQKFNNLKSYNKGLKTLLALGGWNEGSARFSRLVAEPESRAVFAGNVVSFLRRHGFDGLDLDWEYPGARDGASDEDKDNYTKLIKELRAIFNKEKPRLLLTVAVPAGLEWIEKGFDIRAINGHIDFFNMLTYDFHASTEPNANHHAALRSGGEQSTHEARLNVEWAVEHYLKEGADRDKLVIGIPTYGRSYTLFNAEGSNGIGAPSSGPGKKGKYTKEPGYLAYYEICSAINSSTLLLHDARNPAQGPYATSNQGQWVGYDDPRAVSLKAAYARTERLGGIMFWSLDNDDFRGGCHGKPYPLIEAGKTALLGGELAGESRQATTVKARANKRKKKPKSTTPHTPLSTTTPLPPTTPDPGTGFECKDEGFFPHPTDCRKYFWCLDAPGLGLVAHHFTCPAGLYFNKNADSCDYSRNVACKPGGSTTTTTIATTTSTTTTTAAPDEYYDEEEEEEEEEEEDDPVPTANTGKSAKEVNDLKDLLALIKRLGGVSELERYLEENPDASSESPPTAKPIVNRFATTKTTTTFRPRQKYTSILRTTSTSRPRSSSTERSVVTRYTSGEDVIVSEPYARVGEGERKYVSLGRGKSTTTTTTEAPEEETEEDEYYDDEPASTTTTTTTVKPKTRLGSRRTTTAPSARVTTRRNLLLGRRTTTKRPPLEEDEVGVEESIRTEVGARRRLQPLRRRPSNQSEPLRTTILDLDYSSTTLGPIRRRVTTTTPRPTTTTTRRPPTTRRPIAYATDDYYYYYEEDDEDQRGAQSRIPAPNQLQRRSLLVESPKPANSLQPLSSKVRLHPRGSVECLDVGLFPHPADCRRYVGCTDGSGRGVVYDCPPGLVFESVGRMCDWGGGEGCG